MTVYHIIARHLVVEGRVQGVGYRDAIRQEASRLGVSGWVRNRRDGSVEAHLQGTEPAVGALLAWAGRGPALAQVAHLTVQDATPRTDLGTRFERLPSA